MGGAHDLAKGEWLRGQMAPLDDFVLLITYVPLCGGGFREASETRTQLLTLFQPEKWC